MCLVNKNYYRRQTTSWVGKVWVCTHLWGKTEGLEPEGIEGRRGRGEERAGAECLNVSQSPVWVSRSPG